MDIKIEAESLKKLGDDLDAKVIKYRRGLVIEMMRALTILKAAAMQNIRSRSGLNVRSGSLLNSLIQEVIVTGNSVVGEMGSAGVPYARVHEEGHNFAGRWVFPRNSKVLAWEQGGQTMFSKGHYIGPFSVPARPYLGPALKENAEKIQERFAIFLKDSLGGKT